MPRASSGDMGVQKVKFRDLSNGLLLSTGEVHIIRVVGLAALLIEMEDAHFHSDSAVLLPDPRHDGTDGEPDADRITGLAVLRACYNHARENASQKLLIVGHTDTTGAPGYNLTLSRLRAEGVLRALTGERERWAELANQKNVVADHQAILKWMSEEFAWDTDPGDIDGVAGSKTKRAVAVFQKRYNREFDAEMAVDGIVGIQTWQAIFDLYMTKLKRMLATDDDGLASFRSDLKFLDSSRRFVGCGETHPIEADRGDDFRSAKDRRVELLFFEPGQEPKLDCHPKPSRCDPGICEIYRSRFYKFKHLDPEPHERATLKVWLLDGEHRRMPGAPYRLRVAGVEREGKADGGGLLTETKLPLAARCSLEWGESLDEDTEFRFETSLLLHLIPDSTEQEDEQARAMLQNLGYSGSLDEMVAAFQADYGLDPKPWFDQPTQDEIVRVHGNGVEAQADDDDDPPYDPTFEPIDVA